MVNQKVLRRVRITLLFFFGRRLASSVITSDFGGKIFLKLKLRLELGVRTEVGLGAVGGYSMRSLIFSHPGFQLLGTGAMVITYYHVMS